MSVKRIFSAGGIILRPVQHAQGKQAWEVLVTQHSKHKGWDFPKGHREIYESEEQTALREVEEETGIKAEIIEKVGKTEYFYYEEGSKVLKTVEYFLMKYVSGETKPQDLEVLEVKWFDPAQAMELLSFKKDKDMLALCLNNTSLA